MPAEREMLKFDMQLALWLRNQSSSPSLISSLVTTSDPIICVVNYKLGNTQGIQILLAWLTSVNYFG